MFLVPPQLLLIMDLVLNICQWNVRGFKLNRLFIEQLVNKHNINIIAIQETHLDDDDDIYLKHFQIFRKDRNSRGGGVLIGIHDSIICQPLNIKSNLELLAIDIIMENISFTLLNCYIPPNVHNYISDLKTTVDNLQRNNPLLMLGDFNSHHPFWNCTNMDKKGKELFNFISSYDLFLINGPQATYFSEQYNSFSTIDSADII